MLKFLTKTLVRPLLALAMVATLPGHAGAANVTYNLSGHLADLQTFSGNSSFPPHTPYFQQQLKLADASTGQPLPQVSFSVGDTLPGSIVLDGVFQLPGTTQLWWVFVNLGMYTNQGYDVDLTQSWVSFFDHGVEISPPGGFQGLGGSGGGLSQSTSAYEAKGAWGFDEMRFSMKVTAITLDGLSMQSATVAAGEPMLTGFISAPVPEPAQAVLLLGGLGALLLARRRAASKDPRV